MNDSILLIAYTGADQPAYCVALVARGLVGQVPDTTGNWIAGELTAAQKQHVDRLVFFATDAPTSLTPLWLLPIIPDASTAIAAAATGLGGTIAFTLKCQVRSALRRNPADSSVTDRVVTLKVTIVTNGGKPQFSGLSFKEIDGGHSAANFTDMTATALKGLSGQGQVDLNVSGGGHAQWLLPEIVEQVGFRAAVLFDTCDADTGWGFESSAGLAFEVTLVLRAQSFVFSDSFGMQGVLVPLDPTRLEKKQPGTRPYFYASFEQRLGSGYDLDAFSAADLFVWNIALQLPGSAGGKFVDYFNANAVEPLLTALAGAAPEDFVSVVPEFSGTPGFAWTVEYLIEDPGKSHGLRGLQYLPYGSAVPESLPFAPNRSARRASRHRSSLQALR